MNIVFTGMPGSGKSVFGNFVANLLGMKFTDTDREISEKYGLSVSDIFEKFGEGFFRDLEEHEIIEAALKDKQVIATGGGAVLNKKAMEALKENGLMVYLCLSPADLLKRLEKSDEKRPLLKGNDRLSNIEKMYRERNGLYLEYADIVLYPAGIEESRNLKDAPIEDKLGALYTELVLAMEKRVQKS